MNEGAPSSPQKLINLSATLANQLTKQRALISPLSGIIISILCRRAREAVSPLRQLPSQFRAISGRRNPTKPSDYVSGIMRPVRTFFGIDSTGDAQGGSLREKYSADWASEVFENAVKEYVIVCPLQFTYACS